VLPSLEEQREQTILVVEDAMRAPSLPLLHSEETVGQASGRIQSASEDTFIVQISPSGWNFVTRDTLQKLLGEGKGEMSLLSALPIRHLPHLHPDMPLDTALRYVSQFPLVPVVHRADQRRLIGIISREDIIKKYQLSGIEES
jgi:CBS domain-containing protein